MMIESAHRLIAGERELDPVDQVRSAHATTVGQDVRAFRLRFVATPAVEQALRELSPCVAHPAELAERRMGPTFIASLRSIGEAGGASWTNDMPAPGAWMQSCIAVRLPEGCALPSAELEPPILGLSRARLRELLLH